MGLLAAIIPLLFNATSLSLCAKINTFRVENNVSAVQVSESLMYVAEVHRRDLNVLYPVSPCNLHSWQTSAGYYTGCCYTATSQPTCMFDKPRELTKHIRTNVYKGNGYEVASRGCSTVDCVVNAWAASLYHRRALLDGRFKAIGCGYSGQRRAAVAWFGREIDARTYAGCLPALPPIPGDLEPRPNPCKG
jgi:hypothetical protein